MNKKETRIYPTHCTSMYCGAIDCTGCELLPRLEEFKRWVSEHDAIEKDPIWLRNVYVATR